MLLHFGVSNHYSIRDYQELSLVASSLKERQEEKLIACAAVPTKHVVPSVVIYGANASGKSNLIDAMEQPCGAWFYCLKPKGNQTEGYPAILSG